MEMESLCFLLVPGPVLGGPAGVALSSVSGRGVAGEALLAEHGVAVVEEEDGVTGALDRGDLSCLGALAGGAVREPASLIPRFSESKGNHSEEDKSFDCGEHSVADWSLLELL